MVIGFALIQIRVLLIDQNIDARVHYILDCEIVTKVKQLTKIYYYEKDCVKYGSATGFSSVHE